MVSQHQPSNETCGEKLFSAWSPFYSGSMNEGDAQNALRFAAQPAIMT
jgi:hypothetical protein